MNIKIYEEKEKEKEQEQEIILRLFRLVNSGRIVLAVADEHGNKITSSSLVSFNEDMKMTRCVAINTTLGLPLHPNGKLRMEGE